MIRLASVLSACALLACGDDNAGDARTLVITFANVPDQAAGRTTLADVTLEARWDDGARAGNVSVDLEVDGGGSLSTARVTTGADGVARFSWTLGALPLPNRLVADAGALGNADLTVRVDPAAALESAPFGEIEAFLAARGTTGSTEDLALAPDGASWVMAHGGSDAGLFRVTPDGKVSAIATTGEALSNPLGLAFGHGGALYVADGGAKALMKVEGGVVTRLQDRDGVEQLLAPNDVAVGPDGTVFVSDTCTGKVYAVHPTRGEILGRIAFDAATEGGPNGLVVGPDGALWMTTENTALFCGHDSVELTAEVAGLFRIPLGGASVFGDKEVIEPAVGVFGDGLAFDAAGNLYTLFDTADGLALDESIVFVRPATGGRLVRALSASDRVYANLAFGSGAFGAETLYLSLLRVVFVPGSPRGLERVEVGVTGAALPPLP